MKDDILEQAFANCNLKYDVDTSREEIQDELDHINETYKKHKGKLEDCERKLKKLKRTYDEDVAKVRERMKEIAGVDDENYSYRSQREDILHQVEVIEYEKLNPDLNIQ